MKEEKINNSLDAYKQVAFNQDLDNTEFLHKVKNQVVNRRIARSRRLSTSMAISTVILAVFITNFGFKLRNINTESTNSANTLLYYAMTNDYYYELDENDIEELADITLNTETSNIYANFDNSQMNTYDFISSLDEEEFDIVLDRIKEVKVITYGT